MLMRTNKTFNLTAVNATTPAVSRVMVSVGVDGTLHIDSTEDESETIDILDRAMEAIDGHRVPPNGK